MPISFRSNGSRAITHKSGESGHPQRTACLVWNSLLRKPFTRTIKSMSTYNSMTHMRKQKPRPNCANTNTMLLWSTLSNALVWSKWTNALPLQDKVDTVLDAPDRDGTYLCLSYQTINDTRQPCCKHLGQNFHFCENDRRVLKILDKNIKANPI